jgi:flagellin-specific chaperone FliS
MTSIQKTNSKNTSKRNRIAIHYPRNLLIVLFFIHHVFGSVIPDIHTNGRTEAVVTTRNARKRRKKWDDLSNEEKKAYVPQHGTYRSPNTDEAWKSVYTKANDLYGNLLTAQNITKQSIENTKIIFKEKELDKIYEYVQIPNDGNCVHHAVAEAMLRYIKDEAFIIEQLKKHIEKIALTEDLKTALAKNLNYEKKEKLHVLLRYLVYFYKTNRINEAMNDSDPISLNRKEILYEDVTVRYIEMTHTGNVYGGNELGDTLQNFEFKVSKEKNLPKIRFDLIYKETTADGTDIKDSKLDKFEREKKEKEAETETKEIVLWNRELIEGEGVHHWDLLIEKNKAGTDLLNRLNIDLKRQKKSIKKMRRTKQILIY